MHGLVVGDEQDVVAAVGAEDAGLPFGARIKLAAQAQLGRARRVVVDRAGEKVTLRPRHLVLATGNSRRQIHTLAEETDAALRAEGDTRLGIEGYEASKWVVQDYGDVMIHVFDPDTRDYYKLEELWADAPKVDWENEE